MDAISETRLAELHPKLQDKVHGAMSDLAAEGVFFRVAQGLRTYAEQDKLYAQGRTVKLDEHGGLLRPVTNARGGYSNHNFGCAVDCYPFLHGNSGDIDWDHNSVQFRKMIAALKAEGLAWGGDWVHFPDYPHFQLANVPVTPTDIDRAAFARGGIKAVWAMYP